MKYHRLLWPFVLSSALASAACSSAGAPGAVSPPAAGPTQVDSGQPPQNKCDAAAAQSLVGQVYAPAMLAQAMTAAGADQARMLHVDSITTQEFMMGRLNLVIDKEQRVAHVRCG
ncbi:I78 family peptidase inhibitor [Ottowia sp. VDI28]|uniref:I78 family peptidase inhibitor n=1 Tax=Ottowia sp. VDI28 TaxID=3133968 RepID=UPI003C30738D